MIISFDLWSTMYLASSKANHRVFRFSRLHELLRKPTLKLHLFKSQILSLNRRESRLPQDRLQQFQDTDLAMPVPQIWAILRLLDEEPDHTMVYRNLVSQLIYSVSHPHRPTLDPKGLRVRV